MVREAAVTAGAKHKIDHNSLNIQARRPKICRVLDLDKTLKYRLVRGIRRGGSMGVRGQSCIKIAITHLYFKLEVQNLAW